MVLDATSLKSRYWQDWLLLRVVMEGSVAASLVGLQMAIFALCLLHQVCSQGVCVCVQISPFQKDKSHWIRAPSHDPTLI